MPNKIRNLIGQTFSNLIVKEITNKRKRNSVIWLCICTCGNICEADSNILLKGKKKSCGCVTKKATEKAPFKALYNRYKAQSLKREYIFDLTEEEFKKITKQNCAYCNIEPLQNSKNKTKKQTYLYNGLDRKDNSKGYTLANVVPCCGTCNDIKGKNLTYEEMLVAMQAILKFRS